MIMGKHKKLSKVAKVTTISSGLINMIAYFKAIPFKHEVTTSLGLLKPNDNGSWREKNKIFRNEV